MIPSLSRRGGSNAGTQYGSLHEQNHRFWSPSGEMEVFSIALAGPSAPLHLPLRCRAVNSGEVWVRREREREGRDWMRIAHWRADIPSLLLFCCPTVLPFLPPICLEFLSFLFCWLLLFWGPSLSGLHPKRFGWPCVLVKALVTMICVSWLYQQSIRVRRG